MKRILTSFAFVAASLAFAQVGVNAGDAGLPPIANDAVFQVSNKTNEAKGVLLPSVSLTAKDDKVTTSNGTNTVTTGLMVWNDGLSGLTPAGYYYWNGTSWILTGNVDNTASSASVRTDAGTSVTITEADDYVRLTGAVTSINMPTPSAANIGKKVCIYNESSSTGNFTPIGVGPQAAALSAGNSCCYVSDGTDWISFTGY